MTMPISSRIPRSLVLLAVASIAATVLSGCALSTASGNAAATTVTTSVAGAQGTVFGGSQAIGGATITVYAAGSSGYGQPFAYSSGTSLMTASVQTATDGTGSFSLRNSFSCPASNPNVYIVATGGNPGLYGTNANLALMSALGPCLNIGVNTHIRINEMTTVASVWALAPFMTGIQSIGTSSTNVQGLNNAFATANNLVNMATGVPGGTTLPANAVLPLAKMNTLANALEACVNSPGGVANDHMTNCGTLFGAATVGTSVPADTITAAMNIAHNPGTGMSAIFGLTTSQSPFQNALGAPPTDWNLVVSYSGGGLSTPKGIAVDAGGNVWTPNQGNSSVTELSNTGAPLSTAAGYTAGSVNLPVAIAIDESGSAWVANGNSTVTKLTALGASGTLYTGGGLSSPKSLAVDGSGNVWVANSGNASVTEISTSGSLSNDTGAGLNAPNGIAISPK